MVEPAWRYASCLRSPPLVRRRRPLTALSADFDAEVASSLSFGELGDQFVEAVEPFPHFVATGGLVEGFSHLLAMLDKCLRGAIETRVSLLGWR